MVKRVSLPFTFTHPRTGIVYYRRAGRSNVALGRPEDDGFLARYEAAKAGRPAAPKDTTIASLIASYRGSARWANLSPRSKQDYLKALAYLAEKIGPRDVSCLTRPVIIEAMEANHARGQTRFANYLIPVCSALCQHAQDIGWRRDNPAAGIRAFKIPKDRQKPHIPWPDWAVAKMRAEGGAEAVLAFELGIGTTQRPEDLTRFRWADYDGEWIVIRSSKTGAAGRIPCTPQLKAALDAAKKTGLTILARSHGRAHDYNSLARLMMKERKRLGLEEFDLHALRYRGIMELAWAGCTDEQIASHCLHLSMKMIRKYAGEARQVTRAREAGVKRQERTGGEQ